MNYSGRGNCCEQKALSASTQQSADAAEEVSEDSRADSKAALQAKCGQMSRKKLGSKAVLELGKSVEKNQEHLGNVNSASNKVGDVVEEGLKEIDNFSPRVTEESNEVTKRNIRRAY